eukprot:scaffold601887_cov22-Prasinocladus_malaysianus.AAC.1
MIKGSITRSIIPHSNGLKRGSRTARDKKQVLTYWCQFAIAVHWIVFVVEHMTVQFGALSLSLVILAIYTARNAVKAAKNGQMGRLA